MRSVNDYDESEAEKDKSAKTSSGGSTPCGGSSAQSPAITTNIESEKKRVNASVQVSCCCGHLWQNIVIVPAA